MGEQKKQDKYKTPNRMEEIHWNILVTRIHITELNSPGERQKSIS